MPMLGPAGSGGFQVLRLEKALHAGLEQPLPKLLPGLPPAGAAGAAHRRAAAGTAVSCPAGAAHRDIARSAAKAALRPARKAALAK